MPGPISVNGYAEGPMTVFVQTSTQQIFRLKEIDK